MKLKCLTASLIILLSSSAVRAQNLGGFVSLQPREIAPGLYARFYAGRVAYQWSLSVPVLLNDRYNADRSNLSLWSVYMAGIVGIEYLTGGSFEVQTDSSGLTLPGIVLLMLPALSNGQLSVDLLDKSVSDEAGVQVAPFVGWNTALFEMRDTKWFRFAPYAGISCARIFGSATGGKKRLAVALNMGIKEDFEYSSRTERNLNVFFAIEVGFR